jgi:hypothetical protein
MCKRFDIHVSSNKFDVVLTQEILLMEQPIHTALKILYVACLKNKFKTRLYRDYRLLG